MTFIEMVESVATNTRIPKFIVKLVLRSFITLTRVVVLDNGCEVVLPRIGKFVRRKSPEKMVRFSKDPNVVPLKCPPSVSIRLVSYAHKNQ